MGISMRCLLGNEKGRKVGCDVAVSCKQRGLAPPLLDIKRENITNRLRLWTVTSDTGPADPQVSDLPTGNGKQS